jgi:hypothetical protein
VIDRIAIGNGIWTISETYTTGLGLLGLPLEEMAFFVVTNCFVVQGLVLLPWVTRRLDRPGPDPSVEAPTPGEDPATDDPATGEDRPAPEVDGR